jgi:P4 family phage/plasmid primase-like protien
LIQHIVGEKNYASISLQDLSKRFYPAELYGKILNACADIKGGVLDDISNLKKASGEDTMVCERKNRDPFFFRSYAKLIFSANKIPLNMDEKSNALYRRMLILSMNRVMKEEEKDRELLIKLKRETEYIIYLACVSLSKLYDDGKFLESKNSREQVQKLYRAADSVKAFLDERMVERAGNRLERVALYDMYADYCKENGRTAHSPQGFYQSLEDKGYKLGRTKKGRYVEGLAVLEPEFDYDDDESNPFSKG